VAMATAAAEDGAGGGLSRSQIEALDRDGYVVVADAIDTAWVGRLLRAFENAPAQANGTQHVEVTPATPEHESWLELALHPALVVAAEHVLRGPFRVRDLHGRYPLPGYGQQGLHSDWMERAPGSPYFVVSAIWMLDDFARENGATRVVPASHLLTRGIPRALAQPLARHPEERVITGKAGSALIFNGHTWHSGRKNESGQPRRAVQIVIVAA
jgi:ectoine hydroxylase-related dioxygenase (phytanoyl-CoA dioxygenase family)